MSVPAAATLRLATDDGGHVVVSHYRAEDAGPGARGAAARDTRERGGSGLAAGRQLVVVAGATATRRRHYAAFARWLQSRGVDAVLLDYRGIGDSRDGPLRSMRHVDFGTWTTHDLGAVVGYAVDQGPTWLVGHSLGGHAIGRLPQPNDLQAAYTVGTGTGWSGWMSRREAARVELFWRVVGPVTGAVLGYVPMSRIGMGEDIPLGVFRDWKHWCGLPRYFFDDPEAGDVTAPFADVRIPIAAAVATDDAWAPPASRDAFFAGYPAADVQPVDIEPSELGVERIGHMGYFRREVGQHLWPRILQWLCAHGLRPTGPSVRH